MSLIPRCVRRTSHSRARGNPAGWKADGCKDGDAGRCPWRGKLATIDGGVSASCIGNVTLTTVQPIHIAAGARCPTAGLIAVQRDDGASGQIQFNANGGVVIHYGDGTPDKTAASCRDVSLNLGQ
jgi:hypothetical protein